MINLEEINGEISKLESQPASYSTIEKLSWLYTVRDHIKSVPIGDSMPKGESEYYCACCNKSIGEVMEVMDDLMDALMVLQPRLYNIVMAKLS